MKRGEELGKAIAEALELKIDGIKCKSKAEVARALGVQPPSLYGWMARGRISKAKLLQILNFFSDVTTPQHWGLEDWPDAVYVEPDAHLFVSITVEAQLPISIAQQVLQLLHDHAVEG